MNLNIWDIMGPAFFECLILVGIHSYLGLHVIRRKVIFVDLALAQIAALGTTVGFLFGIMPGTQGAYWFSLTFAIIGAAVFSVSRIRHEKIPQEAVIGLVYAIAAAVSILVIDKAPHGAEHIKELLTGSILWVKWGTIETAAIVYALVGVFHFIFRDKFILISEHPEKAYEQGLSVRFWDFLFYVSFGIVITHSVGTAGVLLVFVFLVVPAITSMMITDVLWKQLVIGWTMGLFVTVIGLYISYVADLPSGPTVVAFYGLVLTLVAIGLYLFKARKKSKAFANVAIGIGVTLLVTFGIIVMGRAFKKSEQKNHPQKTEAVFNDTAFSKIKKLNGTDLQKYLAGFNNTDSLLSFFNASNDKYQKFQIAQRLVNVNLKAGVKSMLSLLKDTSLPFVNQEIADAIKKVTHLNFSYEPLGSDKQNRKAIKEIETWLKNN
jgi:zinc/manganese transport system permease protein